MTDWRIYGRKIKYWSKRYKLKRFSNMWISGRISYDTV